MNSEQAASRENSGSLTTAGWICLILGWVMYFVPVPGLSTLIGSALVFVAFVIAIVGMSKREGGIMLLLASLIGSPIAWMFGFSGYGMLFQN